MSTPRLRSAGMALIEVLIACTVLVLAISAAMGAIGSSSATSLHRQNADRALAEIASQVEFFQAMDDASLNQRFGTNDAIYFDVAGLQPGRDPETKVQMTKPLMVQRVHYQNSVRLTTLRFLVSWNDVTGPGYVEQFFHFTERH